MSVVTQHDVHGVKQLVLQPDSRELGVVERAGWRRPGGIVLLLYSRHAE